MENCLFCKMASGEIQPDVVYDDEEVLAFRDINPQAPVHVLVIPKRHISTLNDLEPVNAVNAEAWPQMGAAFSAICGTHVDSTWQYARRTRVTFQPR